MKYACNTCGARYAIPDSRVIAAGEHGLRVRCSRCRAIMAVCFADRDEVVHDEDITQPLGLRRRKQARAPGAPARGPALGTEVGMAAADAGPVPAALSASGVYRPLPGVSRGVTGVHMPRVGAALPGRDWYAAFGGRPRGPFSRVELELLAEQGRVRSSTLIWRPGFDSWRRVRGDGAGHDGELEWLRDIVVSRKRRERAASERAAREHGIYRLHLDDFATAAKTPPPLPAVTERDLAQAADSHARRVMLVGRSLPGGRARSNREADDRGLAFAADRVFGEPHLGEPSVRAARARRHHTLAFTAGALLAALGLLLATYTLPALGVSLPALAEALLTLVR